MLVNATLYIHSVIKILQEYFVRIVYIHNSQKVEFKEDLISVGDTPVSKNLIIRINAPPSRQPLVKGERLVRIEVSAAIVAVVFFYYSQSRPNITGMRSLRVCKHRFRLLRYHHPQRLKIRQVPQRVGCATAARVQNRSNTGASDKQSLCDRHHPKKIE